jgi:hypothetical protein
MQRIIRFIVIVVVVTIVFSIVLIISSKLGFNSKFNIGGENSWKTVLKLAPEKVFVGFLSGVSVALIDRFFK